jgi:hypothetical protein
VQNGILSAWKPTELQDELPSFQHSAGVMIAVHDMDYWGTADGSEEEKSFHRLNLQICIHNRFLMSP